MPDPRILIAWLVLIVLIVLVIITPIAVVVALRARRRGGVSLNAPLGEYPELREFLRTRTR